MTSSTPISMAPAARGIVAAALLLGSSGCDPDDSELTRRPIGEVRVETAALERFAQALGEADAAAEGCPPLARYLDEGGQGPLALVEGGPEALCEAVDAQPERYRAVADSVPAFLREAEAIPELLHRWRGLHPAAPLPDVHLAVGAGDRDAARVGNVIVVGVERLEGAEALGPVVARHLGRAAQRPPLFLPVAIPGLAVRETWLAAAIREGSADFTAVLVSGRLPNPELHEWARPLEEELWARFSAAADRRPSRVWLDERILEEPPPGDPARFVGYRIVEGFWARSANRPEALREILGARDFDDLLDRSGYAGAGPPESAPPSLRGFRVGTWPGFDCGRVRVGEARLHACTAGEGPVPVVLEADPDLDHRSWHAVAPKLARRTRVVVYDRSGAGQSEPGPEPRTPDRPAHELADLLQVVAGPGPYLLVGPAGAIPFLEDFARLYPWRTAQTFPLSGDARLEAAEAVRRVTEAVERLAATAPLAPAMVGEPAGCWGLSGTGTQAGRILRLASLPQGAEAAGGRDAHPVLAVPGDAPVGHWRPRGTEAIELAVDAGASAVLERTAQGAWRGPGGSVSLVSRPCELPD